MQASLATVAVASYENRSCERDSRLFRFSGGGYACPYCHSRTGWSYLREYGKEYGLCFACSARNFPLSGKMIPPVAAIDPSPYIPLPVAAQTFRCYGQNPFVEFLINLLGEATAHQVGAQFLIGTAKKGGTVFWHVDKQGFFRKPKIVFYGKDGKRIKDDPYKKPHFAGYTTEKGYSLPLFGEHQLHAIMYPVSAPVVLVESEKTACIGYAILPRYIWLATGGATALNQKRAQVLKGRTVCLLPDADEAGRAGAEKSRQKLRRMGIPASIVDLFPDRDDHRDLADYVVGLKEKPYLLTLKRQLPLAHPLPEK